MGGRKKASARKKPQLNTGSAHRPVSARSSRGMSFVRSKRPDSAASTQVDLPQMLPCAGECGFFGSPHTMNLCSVCYNKLSGKAKEIKEKQAVQELLSRTGFETMADFKLHLAFQALYPNAFSKPDRDSLPGVHVWQTTIHPLSQFDQVPQRGNSACTYIAGVTAVRFALREEIPGAEVWADSIVRGVKAFHTAVAKNSLAEQHADIEEALPFVLPTLGFTEHQAKELITIGTTIVTLHKPDDISESDFHAILGDDGFPGYGKEALVQCLANALTEQASAESDDDADLDDVDVVSMSDLSPDSVKADGPARLETALVITRPPETYCILKDSQGRVFWRDSHRRKQFDFDSVAVFRSWLEADNVFTVPMTGCPLAMNQVAVSNITPTISAHLAEGMTPLPS